MDLANFVRRLIKDTRDYVFVLIICGARFFLKDYSRLAGRDNSCKLFHYRALKDPSVDIEISQLS
jgi:hypothetical protein